MGLSVERLVIERFFERRDVFAKQQYTHGQWGYWRVNAPITALAVRFHLAGRHTIGAYQLGTDNRVRWTCWDFDRGTFEAPRALWRALRRLGLDGLLEYSGSKGWHVWLFHEPVKAAVARALGQWLLADAAIDEACEVFPKQSALKGGDGFGNLVKVPLGVHRKTGNRCRFVDADGAGLRDQVGALRDVTVISKRQLRDLFEINDIEIPKTRQRTERWAGGGIIGVDAVTFIGQYVALEPKRGNADEWVGLCPFHDDRRTPNLEVNARKQCWWCWRCQQGGGVVEFQMRWDERPGVVA